MDPAGIVVNESKATPSLEVPTQLNSRRRLIMRPGSAQDTGLIRPLPRSPVLSLPLGEARGAPLSPSRPPPPAQCDRSVWPAPHGGFWASAFDRSVLHCGEPDLQEHDVGGTGTELLPLRLANDRGEDKKERYRFTSSGSSGDTPGSAPGSLRGPAAPRDSRSSPDRACT